MEKIIKEFKERLAEIEEGLETDFIAFEQQLLDLEEELYDTVDFMHTPQKKATAHIYKKLNEIQNKDKIYLNVTFK